MYSKNYDTSASEYIGDAGRSINKPDHSLLYMLLIAISIVLALGLWNLYSASSHMPGFFTAQIRSIVISIAVTLFIGFLFPFRYVNHYAYWFVGLNIVLLVAVLIFGHTSNGSTRWLKLGPVALQPSEIAKIGVALLTARFFADYSSSHSYRLRDMSLLLTGIGLFCFLIFIQPDFGTTGLCLFIAFAQLFFIRINLRSIMSVLLVTIPLIPLAWFVLLRDYQKSRIITVLNPELDPYGKGYNSIQSLVAIGSGQAFGKGYMKGTQTQLQFLPEKHTDFVFPVFAEENGFWLGLILFILYLIITVSLVQIAQRLKDTFASLVCIGVAAMIFSQFFINIAMTLGIFPIVGMTLPFFSYGGSSLLSLGASIGLVIAAHRQKFIAKKGLV